MNDVELEQKIRERTTGTAAAPRLSCAAAHQLAAELGIELSRIGELCQRANIKITHCQLGCFGAGKHGN